MAHGDFAEFFAVERDRSFRLAFVIVNDRDLAEDVTQEAFARVLARWSRVRDPGSYLRRAVVNGARSAVRRQVRSRALRARLLGQPAEISEFYTGDAIDYSGLSSRQRVLIALRYHEQMTDREISDVTGMPLGTVKSDLRRGLERLRRTNGN